MKHKILLWAFVFAVLMYSVIGANTIELQYSVGNEGNTELHMNAESNYFMRTCSFTTNNSFILSNIDTFMWKVNSPSNNVNLKLCQSNASGYPVSCFASSSYRTFGSLGTGSGYLKNWSFNQVPLNASTKYVIWFNISGTNQLTHYVYINMSYERVSGEKMWTVNTGGALTDTGWVDSSCLMWLYSNSTGAGTNDTINLSSTINPQYLITNLTYTHIWALANTSNQWNNATLYINSSSYQSYNFSTGTNYNVSFNFTFLEGNTTFYINVTNPYNSEKTSTGWLFKDSIPPVFTTNLDGNLTNASGYLQLYINVTERNFFKLNYSDDCGNRFNNGTNHTYYNTTFFVLSCGTGTRYANLTVCDGKGTTIINCVTQYYTFVNNYNAQINVTAINYTGGKINSFTTSLIGTGIYSATTTSGDAYLYGTTGSTYNITFNGTPYEYINMEITLNSTYTNFTFYPYTENSFNFSIYWEVNKTLVTGRTVYIEFLSGSGTYNYSTSTGLLYVDLITPDDYTIRYYGDVMGRNRHRYYTLTPQTHNELSLYVINSSDSITVTIYDQLTLNKLENAVVFLQRYYPLDNEYITVAEYKSDYSGIAYFDVQLQDQYYKFLVDYPWKSLKLTTSENYIESSNINLYISLEESVGQSYDTSLNIINEINYDATGNYFEVVYNDATASASNYCLYVKELGYYGYTTINSTCSASNSATLIVSGLTGNKTYYSLFTATIGGSEININQGYITKENATSPISAGFGLFLTIFLMLIFSVLTTVHILIPITAMLGLILGKFIGLIAIDWAYIIITFISTIILSMIIQMKK